MKLRAGFVRYYMSGRLSRSRTHTIPRRNVLPRAMDQDQNRDWLGELRNDGERSLADAFANYRPRLRRVVEVRMGTRLKSRVDPSDVLQETFLDARRQLDRFLDGLQVVDVLHEAAISRRVAKLRPLGVIKG